MDMRIFRVTGRIYTLDEKRPFIHEFWVKNGEILIEDNDENMRFGETGATEMIVRDGIVLPGFVDSHLHVLSLGKYLDSLDLRNVTSIRELKVLLKEKIDSSSSGEWIFGGGWDHEKFVEKRYPSRFDIDEISPNNPVLLYRACRHVYLLNSKALEVLNISKYTQSPPGGVIDKDENGELTGILKENAYNELVLPKLPKSTIDKKKKWILNALTHVASKGITFVQTNDKECFEVYKELEKEGKLNVRVMLTIPFEELDSFAERGIRTDDGSDFFRLGRVKLFADGSLGGETAALREPYNGSNNNGVLIDSPEVLSEKVKKVVECGWEVEIHAIGDRAIDVALEAVSSARNSKNVSSNFRHVITHCQVTPDDIIEKMKDIGVVANIQPIFLNTDLHWAEKRLGIKRAKKSYAWNSLISAGILCTGGSDAPIEPVDPLFGIYAAVTRKDLSGYPEKGWNAEEKISVHEAIKLFTVNGAKVARLENKKGLIKHRYWADFVVLDRDIFELDDDKIKDAKVVATIVNGNISFLSKDYKKYISFISRNNAEIG